MGGGPGRLPEHDHDIDDVDDRPPPPVWALPARADAPGSDADDRSRAVPDLGRVTLVDWEPNVYREHGRLTSSCAAGWNWPFGRPTLVSRAPTIGTGGPVIGYGSWGHPGRCVRSERSVATGGRSRHSARAPGRRVDER